MSQAPVVEETSRRRSSAPAPAEEAGVKKTKKVAKAAPAPKEQPRLVGGPRVDLLPPIVEVRRKQNATLRLLMLGLAGIAAIAIVASLAVWLLATGAERGLADEQLRTTQLLQEQNKYTDVIAVKSQLLDYDNAQIAALYAETDWARLMRELDAALPAGVALESESITIKGLSTDAAAAGAEGMVTIDAPGVIEILFSAKAPTFDSPTPLLNSLQNLTGYVSASVSAVSNTGDEGYTITGAVQLDANALGGTARTGSLDAEALKELHDALMLASTAPPAPAPAATDAATDGAEGATGTGE